jgi:cytosine/adenosine deaminase-related metal-dependent hydrolase
MPRPSLTVAAPARALTAAALLLAGVLPAALQAQRPELSAAVRQFVAVDDDVVVLRNVRVIDGTGAPARAAQTIVIRDGVITDVGPATSLQPPTGEGVRVLDLDGRTVLPGLVMVHEHLYYPTGPGVYAYLPESFTRLYLAGGVTSMRTGGSMNAYGEINFAGLIESGRRAGPWLDVTAPYLEGPGLQLPQVYTLRDAEDARRMVNFWGDAGATSYKAYMNITRDMLGAAIDEAHRRGARVTAHLCSVTYAEAAALGIDNLEHGFLAATDFVEGREPDRCPGQGRGQAAIAAMDVDDPRMQALIADLVQRDVAITSTLAIFETFTPGRPLPPGLDVLTTTLRENFERVHAGVARNTSSIYTRLFPKAGALEVAFFRAGGLLLAGTDPTGSGGVVPGYANHRALELLVEAGLTPLEAIRVGTLNGATYLRRADRIGTIAVGMQADLLVVQGDPSLRIEDIRNVELVFRQGVGYDPERLRASVRGSVGLY